MSSLSKILLLVVVVLAVGAGLVVWKTKVGGHGAAESFNRITAAEMELLLKDANPMMVKRLAESPEMREEQAKNLRELLALASQARKDGIASDPYVETELENMRAQLIAVNYDQELNKGKSLPPLASISEERVKEFWGENGEASGISWIWKGAGKRTHEAEFQKSLNAKIELYKRANPTAEVPEITPEQMEQARESFAKIKIYEEEYEDKVKSGTINPELKEKIELQEKLQQAQFLARLYAQTLTEKINKVTDADIDKYIAEHPELDPKEKRAKAEDILNRAKSGEDFAKLANEFSQDPGNKSPTGESQGGLYKDVPRGRMMPEFEAAALAMEPGQVVPNLVETPYGYHIIKLEKKGETKSPTGETSESYDVRHILIMTGVKDPENPMSREMPVRDFVRSKLEQEKEKQILEEIVANNPVEVAIDYKVPEVSEEQMQQMLQQQMQMQMPQQMPEEEGEESAEAPKEKAPAAKPAPKK